MNLGDHNGVKLVMKLHMNIQSCSVSKETFDLTVARWMLWFKSANIIILCQTKALGQMFHYWQNSFAKYLSNYDFTTGLPQWQPHQGCAATATMLTILQDPDKAYPCGPAWHLLVASKGEIQQRLKIHWLPKFCHNYLHWCFYEITLIYLVGLKQI